MSKLAYQRLDDLLELLAKQTTPLPMKELAKSFSISERTVRTDIANLNDLLSNVGATITLLRGQGYLMKPLYRWMIFWIGCSLAKIPFTLI